MLHTIEDKDISDENVVYNAFDSHHRQNANLDLIEYHAIKTINKHILFGFLIFF